MDSILYSSFPVFSSGELRKELNALKDSKGCVVFLNCGAQLDLTKTWLGEQEECVALVLDSHRPIHHNNLDGREQIKVCVDLEQERIDELPTQEEIDFYNQYKQEIDLEEAEEDDLSDASESEGDDLDDEEPKEEAKSDARSQCDDEELLYGDDTEKLTTQKRTLPNSSKAENRFRRRKRTVANKLRNYYEGDYFGISASMLAYHVTKTLNRETKDLLWLCIVGLTD